MKIISAPNVHGGETLMVMRRVVAVECIGKGSAGVKCDTVRVHSDSGAFVDLAYNAKIGPAIQAAIEQEVTRADAAI